MQLLQASRDVILKPLTTVSGIIERRNTMPILANILIRKEGNKVDFIGSDIEVEITAQAEFGNDDESNVSTTVGARKLLDILRALPDGRDVTINLNDGILTVLSGKSRFALQTMPADAFPAVKMPEQWETSISMPQSKLKHMFNMAHFAMAHQDIRYYLNGMLLVVEPGFVRTVATDGHRLAYSGVALNGISGKQEVIIPRKTVLEMQRLLSETDDEIKIDIAPGQIRFGFNGVTIISKLVEGKFPDFTRVIPTGYTRHFNIDRNKLYGSLQRAAILTTEKLKGVRLQIDSNVLKITSSNAEQEQAQEELEIEYGHEPLDLGFNVQYLLDVLSNVKHDTVCWSVQPDANASALITVPNDSEFKYVVMPMRI